MTLVLSFHPWIGVEVKEPVSPELTHIVVADPDGACRIADNGLGNTKTNLWVATAVWVAEAMVVSRSSCRCKAAPVFDRVDAIGHPLGLHGSCSVPSVARR